MNEIHESNYGWTANFTIKDQDGSPVDLSGSNSVQIVFTRPNNSGSFTRDATFTTDGVDGNIYYVDQENEIVETGTWQMQAVVTWSSSVLRSNIEKFKVLRNL